MQYMPSAEKRQKPRGFKQSRNGLREAILGLLAIRPMTGYDLSRSYRRALQQIWYAPLGQVYPTLRQMRRDGLLRVSVKVQRHRPNRKIYSLTAEGRKLLVLWLSQPAALPRMHHEFIHKLFQLGHVNAADRGELVEAYINRCREWALDLRRAAAMLEPSLKGPNAENAWFQLLSLRHLCRIVECETNSARQIAEGIRGHARERPRRSGGSPPSLENAAFAGQTLSPND
jgi:PadR family transcriptional regulator, regulatory protein AphA